MTKCGDCVACCLVFSIEELNKPKNVMCEHCTGKGCGIHSSRPQTCKDFECAYYQANWPEKYRPDNSGILLSYGKKGTYKALIVGDRIDSDMLGLIERLEKKGNVKFTLEDTRENQIQIS